MKFEQFLCADRLSLRQASGPLRTLISLTKRFELHRLFEESPDPDDAVLLSAHGSLRQAISRGKKQSEGRTKKQYEHYFRRFTEGKRGHGRVSPSRMQRASHLEEIITLIEPAVADANALITLDDVCAGDGRLTLNASLLRADTRRALTATCWDIDETKQERFEQMFRPLFSTDHTIDFRGEDIRSASFHGKQTGVPHYILSKHPCGDLADAIISNIGYPSASKAPWLARLMTCCHPKAKTIPLAIETFGVRSPEWEIIRSNTAAQTYYTGQPEPIVARRVMDTLRACAMPQEWQPIVQEVLPYRCAQNHIINFGTMR